LWIAVQALGKRGAEAVLFNVFEPGSRFKRGKKR